MKAVWLGLAVLSMTLAAGPGLAEEDVSDEQRQALEMIQSLQADLGVDRETMITILPILADYRASLADVQKRLRQRGPNRDLLRKIRNADRKVAKALREHLDEEQIDRFMQRQLASRPAAIGGRRPAAQ